MLKIFKKKTSPKDKMGSVGCSQASADCYLWLHTVYVPFQVERKVTWLYSTTIVCYHAFYLPLLYITFLGDFFEEEDMHLENMYYSEMKAVGFFDADWE
ncbi:hypothetical protein ES332_D12G146800v1 [Gossypium tomentosum]|uniref:Uncharacterized protein n=1 Tax=Gossypium tomentosum TaxID=34277 RepID=A0A5D2I967_GOSTO|nr:hypothetical protein ES332_D12G146800v1 [Gossypium tomentosum]